jgi:hypothetical protein
MNTLNLSSGHRAAALADDIKRLLVPFEDVCRYRERRSDDAANFEVTPRHPLALPFDVAIAPGGVNIISKALVINEISTDESEIILGVVAAILHGRLRQVRLTSAAGKPLAWKTFTFNEHGHPVYKQRRKFGMVLLGLATKRTERMRFSAYRG